MSVESHDPVNNPVHYKLTLELGEGDTRVVDFITIRDAILSKLDGEPISARAIDYYSRAFEYLGRWMDKNGVEDLQKAQWYLERLINECQRIGYDPAMYGWGDDIEPDKNLVDATYG